MVNLITYLYIYHTGTDKIDGTRQNNAYNNRFKPSENNATSISGTPSVDEGQYDPPLVYSEWKFKQINVNVGHVGAEFKKATPSTMR